MASASSNWALCAVAVVFLSLVVAGCTTTQDANKRAEITAGRTLASREPLELKGTDPDIHVVRTSVIHGKDRSAVVVVLRNRGEAPVNDLPIEVGPEGGQPLNARPNVPYFQSHAPAIAPSAEVTWVYLSRDPIASNRAFARVGTPSPHPLTTASHVSELEVGDSPGPAGSSVQAEVTNDTGVPQYNLDVYAVARRGDRYVAAGRANLEHLGVSKSAHLSLPLIGDAKGTQIQVFAPQTLFE